MQRTNLLESVLCNYICSFVGHNSRDQLCSIGGDLCWLFHLHLLSSVVYLLFLDIEVIIEGLLYTALHTCIKPYCAVDV